MDGDGEGEGNKDGGGGDDGGDDGGDGGGDDDDDDEGHFELVTEGGYTRQSSVTETEDVSYVSSPYLPNCVPVRSLIVAPPNPSSLKSPSDLFSSKKGAQEKS